MKRRQTPTDITAATERLRELPRADTENGRRQGRPDRETTQDPQGRVEVRLPSNSSNGSHRDDGGSDRSSRYTYRAAADVPDNRNAGGGNMDLRTRLFTSVTAFTALAERPAVWPRYTTWCALNSVSSR